MQRADSNGTGRIAGAVRCGLSVRMHRIVLMATTIVGFFGGVWLGHWLFGSWGEILGALIGALVFETLFHRLLPALCPDCGQRADCTLSSREIVWAGERNSETVIRYRCRSCGFASPRPVTPVELAEAGQSAIRVARFARGFFTLIGFTMGVIATAASAHALANSDLKTAGLGAGFLLFAVLFCVVTRRALTSFAETIRNGTQPGELKPGNKCINSNRSDNKTL